MKFKGNVAVYKDLNLEFVTKIAFTTSLQQEYATKLRTLTCTACVIQVNCISQHKVVRYSIFTCELAGMAGRPSSLLSILLGRNEMLRGTCS